MHRLLRIALALVLLLASGTGCNRHEEPAPTVRKLPAPRFPMQKGLDHKGTKAKG
jgi:hypothetical protein